MRDVKLDKKYDFQLIYKADGVYLEVHPETIDSAMTQSDLLALVKDKQIESVSFTSISEALKKGVGACVQIAPAQEETFRNDRIEVSTSKDGMEATMIILKGDERGKRLNVEDVIACLNETYKITTGIDEEAISEMIAGNVYNEDRIIAVGKPAVDGISAEITYHFELIFNKVGKQTGGRIDFKQLNLVANVSKGSVIASKTKPIPEQDGYNIYGKELKGKPAKDVKFLYGKNVFLSQDGDKLLSAIDGKADIIGNKVVVSKVYSVDGDVDMSVGNINFSGDVVVRGNVMAGFEIRAGGSVEVYGAVEDARIIADENIRIAGNFLGNGKGMLKAGGSVICRSVELGIISAVESVEAQSVMHSDIYCDGVIKVSSEKSIVVGGNMCSGQEIVLNNAGNMKGTNTNLKIGLPDDVFQRFGDIDEEKSSLEKKLSRLTQKKEKLLNTANADMKQKIEVMNEILATQKSLEKNEAEKTRLGDMIENVKSGKIQIRGRGYNGVNIYINNVVKRIDYTVDFTTFTFKDGEIHEVPCK